MVGLFSTYLKLFIQFFIFFYFFRAKNFSPTVEMFQVNPFVDSKN